MNGRHRRNKLIHLISLVLAAVMIISSAGAVFAGDTVDQKAEKILSQMSTGEKIAQMMVVAMPASGAASVQKKYQFGGYVLFARDFKRTSKSGMKKLLASCQESSDIPMLMCVDEEGGTVVRASYYRKFRKSKFRSPRQVYKSGKYKAITTDTRTKDSFLKSLGLNCNFGPVADVTYKKSNFMYKRAFSNSAGKTSKFVTLAVSQMNKDNVVSAVKHFPGYGNNGDTHGRIIRDKRTRATFVTRDLRPFRAGIKSGADMIMVSHTIVNTFDKNHPASLSANVHQYLRDNMGFNGVIITDGLGMKGVTNHAGDQGKAAVMAMKAGNDMLCVTGDYKKCYKALITAVNNGTIPESQIDESVLRILKMKIRRGIIK